MIELQQATKLYHTVIGVNDITIKLEPGTYGLLGPNGSGKTTLINLILGQIKPTIGSVRLFGQNPWRRSALLRRIGLCPASELNSPGTTALEWVAYLTQLHGFGYADSIQRAKQALERVKISAAMNRPMREYSLGMRQRAKIAQAIAHDPDLLILDEPFNGLDPVGRFEMTDFLRSWCQEGKSLILASHILYEVESVQPSFLLISGGRLLASGSPGEVRRILADSPYTLNFSTDDPKRLARLLIEHFEIDSILFNGPRQLTVETRSAAELYRQLPGLIIAEDIRLTEVSSSDESLKTLFSTLMRIHRGESHNRGKNG
jgi:ABC-2 type transport system ATP-binding protein